MGLHHVSYLPSRCAIQFCNDFSATCDGVKGIKSTPESCLTRTKAQDMDKGFVGDTTGNSFSCREYHVGAAKGDADTHCPHASNYGGGICVDSTQVRITSFCTLYKSRCADTGKWLTT